jgi:ArsR family transcriptional regulator
MAGSDTSHYGCKSGDDTILLKFMHFFAYVWRVAMSELISEPQLLEREADVCFALADPTRINIVHALEKHPYNVNELTSELGIPQPMTSRHLKILRERGLVFSTRHGVSVTYALSDPRLIQALSLLADISTKPE